MTINNKIKESIIQSGIKNQNVILAVSGGSDSQVLLKSFPHVSKKFNINCFAIGINHGLRKDADDELKIAEELSKEVGIPFYKFTVKVNAGASVQANARNARYEMLTCQANKLNAKYIVTAHHFDDRAETVLIRLLRGKNFGSLAVLPTVSGNIFRPMLSVGKEEITRYCKRWNLKFANDPSNENTDFLRVKIRKEILPLLEDLNPKFKIRLNELADEALKITNG